ncbi:MAG: nitroreductase family protein [Oscillospiraceae bacterium]|nr:nitroreductase family protein [Oscillospiraceae bacterium]
MAFFDLVKSSRSYRRFDASRKISREELVSFIETVRYAAASVNVQPFKYALSWEKPLNDKIFAKTRWARLLSKEDFPPQTEDEQPTAYILITLDREITENAERFRVDVGICAQTIMLAAAEIGLGGCMIGNYDKEDVRDLMGLDDRYVPMLLLAFGKPGETVVTEDIPESGSTAYYRKDGIHHVPKRSVKEMIANCDIDG